MSYKKFQTTFENNLLTVEINRLAKQADSSVLIRYKDSVLLSVAIIGTKDSNLNYLPLTIFYQEKFYAAGKIPGNFFKREGKPSDCEILYARLVDRSLRPLLCKQFKKEIQIINTVLSNDKDCNNEILAIFISSLTLLVSDAPFYKAVSGICVGKVENKLIINPDPQQREKSDFLLTIAGTKDSLNMIETVAKEIPEAQLMEAMLFGHQFIKKLCLFQEKIQKIINKKKLIFVPPTVKDEDNELYDQIKDQYKSRLRSILNKSVRKRKLKNSLSLDIEHLKETIIQTYQNKAFFKTIEQVTVFDFEKQKQYLDKVVLLFDRLLTSIVREMIIKDKKRIDGRNADEIRKIAGEIGLLPRAHGSALFTRGETQSLAVVTIGALSEGKLIDDLTSEEKEAFIVHYNSPPFSVGSIGRYIMPSRREIGHGVLAKKALCHVLPLEQEFPYTIRIVSEILESNGSSSQATICASSMALMDAGVPLKRPVAGIAMGLFREEKDEDKYVILSDIQGLEDQKGDMDFKVAGTEKGITALQMDIKIETVSFHILEEVLEKARIGRIEILQKMNIVIDKPRSKMSNYIPKVKIINVPIDKIRDIIGTGGKVISQIIDNYDNVKIDIEQDGRIFIMHHNEDIVLKTANYILNLVQEIRVDKVYEVTILRILYDKKSGNSFAAIVQIFPGIEGFIHISKLSSAKVNKVEDILVIGQKILAKCIYINDKGKIDLSLVLD
ncbi:MAG: polyribonucleotide nucleotidyltransferase [Weeping tea tree witches'-broom phytoplasma]|uniref:polyribonucleotide nucleotidyltransferase n=1 Tax=Candidatus Phytoplasma melaleucae TaxID=2982630 RepID=UPI00293ADC90|nr:polyribonucleotide nucleotidyltransferase [Weeping tea tree witches'-broom phytoplasma]